MGCFKDKLDDIHYVVHSVYSIPAHPFGGLVLQVFFGQFGLVDAGILLLTQNFAGLFCRYIFWAGELAEILMKILAEID